MAGMTRHLQIVNNIVDETFIYKNIMKNKIIIIAIMMIMSVVSFDCSDNNNDPKIYPLGDMVYIKYGKSVSFIDGSTLKFSKVINDNRVPLSMCYLSYGSSAKIELSLSIKEKTYSIIMDAWGCNADDKGNLYDLNAIKDTLGYQIQLNRLEPYPNDCCPPSIKIQDYSVKLKITKL